MGWIPLLGIVLHQGLHIPFLDGSQGIDEHDEMRVFHLLLSPQQIQGLGPEFLVDVLKDIEAHAAFFFIRSVALNAVFLQEGRDRLVVLLSIQ